MNKHARLVPLFLALGAASVASAGCEIIADFDRTKIDAGEVPSDATTPDVGVVDAHPQGDTAVPDAPEDSGDAADGATPDGDAGAADAADAADTSVPDTSDAAADALDEG
jgi:hypothetical protein